MGIFLTALKWTGVLLLSAIGTFIVMATLGLSTQLMGWSLVAAAHGDDVMLKYQIFVAWTLGAAFLAFLVRIAVLRKCKNEHSLRWTEYPGHGLTSGVLAGGLAYGAVAVVIAAMKGLGIDVETLGEIDQEAMANLTFMAMFPTFFAMMAAALTAHKNIVEIPKSSPPDQTLSRMLQRLKFLVKHARPWSMRVKRYVWSCQGRNRAAPGVMVETPDGTVDQTETTAPLNHRKNPNVGGPVQRGPVVKD